MNKQNVFELLTAAGVAPLSPMMLTLLQAQLDPAYVDAHIKHMYAERDLGKDYPVSHLINKLLCRDPLPTNVCRCGKCTVCQQTAVDRMKKRIPNLRT